MEPALALGSCSQIQIVDDTKKKEKKNLDKHSSISAFYVIAFYMKNVPLSKQSVD